MEKIDGGPTALTAALGGLFRDVSAEPRRALFESALLDALVDDSGTTLGDYRAIRRRLGYEAAYSTLRTDTGNARVDEFLLAGLNDNDFRIRAATLDALGELGEQRLIEPCIERLRDGYPQVRVAAIRALERLQPGGTWREQLAYECYVPAGSFVMGDNSGEDDEKPAHRVNLDAFYIRKYLVTNAEYKAHRDDIGRSYTIPEGKENHPVVFVSWYDASDYAAWAQMRLPTEAEWEKAASWNDGTAKRGNERMVRHLLHRLVRRTGRQVRRKHRYPWGDRFDRGKCNARESCIFTTTPVGKYSPWGDSPYGCADMAGNVREWVIDWYGAYSSDEQTNPAGPETGTAKVLHGGSFYYNWYYLRAANRTFSAPKLRYYSLGFRCVALGPGV